MVGERLPSRGQALRILRQSGCQRNVVKHCEVVAELAIEIGEACQRRGSNVDLELVEIGALLHDIGRSKTHSVHHAVIGAKIAGSLGLPEKVLAIIKRHVGGGITTREARKLGWPKDIYVPQTLEEKIVSYVDKLIENGKRVPVDRAIEQLYRESKPEAAERVRKLHEEIAALVGDCP